MHEGDGLRAVLHSQDAEFTSEARIRVRIFAQTQPGLHRSAHPYEAGLSNNIKEASVSTVVTGGGRKWVVGTVQRRKVMKF